MNRMIGVSSSWISLIGVPERLLTAFPRSEESWAIHASTDVEFILKAPSTNKSPAKDWYLKASSLRLDTWSLN